MKFDAYAALAELRSDGGGRATPATCATQTPDNGPHVAQVARVARGTAPDGEISNPPAPADACRTSRTCRTGQAVKSENPPPPPGIAAAPLPSAAPPSPSRQEPPPGAIVHLSRYRPVPGGDGPPRRMLPTQPATCDICGASDWRVAMTDRQGRTLHVRCWKAEGGTA